MATPKGRSSASTVIDPRTPLLPLRSGTGHSPYGGKLTLPANCRPSGTHEIALSSGGFPPETGHSPNVGSSLDRLPDEGKSENSLLVRVRLA